MKILPCIQIGCITFLLLAGAASAVAESVPQAADTGPAGTAQAADPQPADSVQSPAAGPAPAVAVDAATEAEPGVPAEAAAGMQPEAGVTPEDADAETADAAADAAVAEIDVPAPGAAPAPGFDPAALHGQWTVKEQHPEAGEVVTLFSVNPDASFAGTMSVADQVVWTYSGNWSLDGNLLTWVYTESTPPLMQVNEAEVDEIIAIDAEKLTYRSGSRDVVETLYRAN